MTGTAAGPLTGRSAANAPGEATAKSAAMPNAHTPIVAPVRRTVGVSAAYVSTELMVEPPNVNHRNAASMLFVYRNICWLTVAWWQHPGNCTVQANSEIMAEIWGGFFRN